MTVSAVELGNSAVVLSGFAFKSEFFSDNDGVPLIRIRDVTRGHSKTFYSGAYTKEFVVQNGDILIGMDGNFEAARWKGGPALLNQRVCRIKGLPTVLDDAYLFHFLSPALKKIEDATPFVTVKHLSAGDVRGIAIPLPPLPEQRRIAAILDQADALRAKRREALAQLDSLTQSIFIEMFGDPAGNPLAWPQPCLGELMQSGPQNGLYKPSTDYGTGTPILRIDAFYDGVVTKLATLKRVRVTAEEIRVFGLAAEDLVINRVNSIEYLGKSALIPALQEPTVFESNMMRFKVAPEKVLPTYLVAFLQTPFIKEQIRVASKDAVNQSSINQQDVKAFKINLPPLARQHSFATRIQAIESLKATHRAALAEFDALFASLQHRAFAGQLS